MTAEPCDTPIGVADRGINPQLIAAMNSIRAQFIASGWDPASAQQATLLLWQSGMAAMTHGGTP